jgi:NADH-quinone oxidoreductase subunit L
MSPTTIELLTFAWLTPLVGGVLCAFANAWTDHARRIAPRVAVALCGVSTLSSMAALVSGARTGVADKPLVGTWYDLADFGSLVFRAGYYVDTLTLTMSAVVGCVSLAVHVYALGYLAEEGEPEIHDDHVADDRGLALVRPGRLHLFYAGLGLFTFSMQGLVLAGNLLQVFVFWELVGFSSYLLIGFYSERSSAARAAGKAFLMNRVGDAGFLAGLMILLGMCGTLDFRAASATHTFRAVARTGEEAVEIPGLFDQIRGQDGPWRVDLDPATGSRRVVLRDTSGNDQLEPGTGARRHIPYFWLIAAGLGLFAGCAGKSAQLPLHTWLPDAMEGPTPVSALVHSATMVAAGVYLVARLAPVLPPEVLTFIAYVGAITLLLGALQAMLADDLKQVLAWSTISQLGYMFVGLGTGGWTAGVFHLTTHASFKALLFLTAGSVIVALHHVQDLRRMGGLGTRLPWTAGLMLAGVVAISGLAIPFSGTVLGEPLAFSGHHSKDAILASALAFVEANPRHTLLFALPALGAGLTSYYMMRLWLMVFAGAPRGAIAREQVREPSPLLLWPMIALAVPAVFAGFGGEHGPLAGWLEHSRPGGQPVGPGSAPFASVAYPTPEAVAGVHDRAAMFGLTAAFAGIVLAWGLHRLAGARAVEDPGSDEFERTWAVRMGLFDELYRHVFVDPAVKLGRLVARFDRSVLDKSLHAAAVATVRVAVADRRFDEHVIDGAVRWVGAATPAAGDALRHLHSGRLRQYVALIVAGVVLAGMAGILAAGRG